MRAWLQAARLPSAVNLQLPLLFGQTLAYATYGAVYTQLCLLLALYGLAMQLFIVFLNDWADRQADALNETPTLFSGGSRVLVERRIEPATLLHAGLFSGVAVLALGLLLAAAHDRPFAPVLFVCGLFLLWSYSLPPLRLNYRGGGELLQALGVGCILPVAGFYVQTGRLPALHPGENPLSIIALIAAYIYLQTAAAIAFTLPDAEADQRAGKRTLAALWGVPKAAAIAIALGLLTHLFLYTSDVPRAVLYVPALPLAGALFLLPASHQSARATLWLTGLLITPAISFALAALYALIYIPL